MVDNKFCPSGCQVAIVPYSQVGTHVGPDTYKTPHFIAKLISDRKEEDWQVAHASVNRQRTWIKFQKTPCRDWLTVTQKIFDQNSRQIWFPRWNLTNDDNLPSS